MDNLYPQAYDEISVAGFETQNSPQSSYNSGFLVPEDEERDPPPVPPHLQHSLLSFAASKEASGSLPAPQNVILNHFYIENRDRSQSVATLGVTHRFRAKFVTVVLYKPIQRSLSWR